MFVKFGLYCGLHWRENEIYTFTSGQLGSRNKVAIAGYKYNLIY